MYVSVIGLQFAGLGITVLSAPQNRHFYLYPRYDSTHRPLVFHLRYLHSQHLTDDLRHLVWPGGHRGGEECGSAESGVVDCTGGRATIWALTLATALQHCDVSWSEGWMRLTADEGAVVWVVVCG